MRGSAPGLRKACAQPAESIDFLGRKGLAQQGDQSFDGVAAHRLALAADSAIHRVRVTGEERRILAPPDKPRITPRPQKWIYRLWRFRSKTNISDLFHFFSRSNKGSATKLSKPLRRDANILFTYLDFVI